MATGKEQQITITASSGLSKDEVETMVSDAEAHADDDKKKKEEIESHNQLDTLIYSTEKTLSEHREKIKDEDAKEVEEAVKKAKEDLESNDVDRMRQGIEELTKASHKIAEVMYQAAKEQGADSPGGEPGQEPPQDGGQADDSEVVDAEFEEK
jgi:molecular chaperone DnaK